MRRPSTGGSFHTGRAGLRHSRAQHLGSPCRRLWLYLLRLQGRRYWCQLTTRDWAVHDPVDGYGIRQPISLHLSALSICCNYLTWSIRRLEKFGVDVGINSNIIYFLGRGDPVASRGNVNTEDIYRDQFDSSLYLTVAVPLLPVLNLSDSRSRLAQSQM